MMAHIQKVKQHGVGQVVAHNRRLREPGHYSNEHIDPERTQLNYRIGGVEDVASTLARAAKGTPAGKLRKNQVAMFSVANTLPRDWPEGRDPKEYFEACHEFNLSMFPTSISLGMDVHLDELTPHGHDAFLPTTEDGRFCYSEVVPRSTYQRYHKELQDYLERKTGLRLQVLLDEHDPDKALSNVPQDRLDAAREALNADLAEKRSAVACEQERLEGLQRNIKDAQAEITDLEPMAQSSAESRAVIAAGAGVDERVIELERRVEAARGNRDEMRDRLARLDGYVRETRSRSVELGARKMQLERGIATLKSRCVTLAERWRERGARAIFGVGTRAAELLRGLGVKAYDHIPYELTSAARTPIRVVSRSLGRAR